jgi:hypothetical protein
MLDECDMMIAAKTAVKRRMRLSFLLPDQSPIFFHRRNIGGRQSGRDVDFSVGHALVDLQFGNGPSVDENEKQITSPFDAQGIESDAAVLIELKECAKTFVGRQVRIKCDHILFGNSRSAFDGKGFAGKFRGHGRGEDGGVARVGFDMEAKHTMSIFGRRRRYGQDRDKEARAQTFHG